MLSNAEQLSAALECGFRIRPKVGGFPYLAEALRSAGVSAIHCVVPSMTTVYVLPTGPVVLQGSPQVSGLADVAAFDAGALVTALRADQAGRSAYPEFMAAAWHAGVVSYDVDLAARTCTYRSATGEQYVEDYPAVDLPH
jgi:uncharacterized protein YbcV (DUF1398 family)